MHISELIEKINVLEDGELKDELLKQLKQRKERASYEYQKKYVQKDNTKKYRREYSMRYYEENKKSLTCECGKVLICRSDADYNKHLNTKLHARRMEEINKSKNI